MENYVSGNKSFAKLYGPNETIREAFIGCFLLILLKEPAVEMPPFHLRKKTN